MGAYKIPSQNMQATEIFRLVVRCRFLITGNGRERTAMSRTKSVATLEMSMAAKLNLGTPSCVQESETGSPANMVTWSVQYGRGIIWEVSTYQEECYEPTYNDADHDIGYKAEACYVEDAFVEH